MAKKNLTGFPEYVGHWKVDGDYMGYWVGGTFQIGRVQHRRVEGQAGFRMFIDEKVKEGKDGFLIKGRLKDMFGIADFEGYMSPRKIIFWKQYRKGHCDQNVIRRPILFDGSLSREIYHGRRFYIGTWTDRDESFAPDTIRNFGSFVLEEYTPSKTLELLMRMDHK